MRAAWRTSGMGCLLLLTALAGCLGGQPLAATDAPGACGLLPSQPQPPRLGLRVEPASSMVTLRTDPDGVTHIYADDAYALFYANGYVQARDRLFQIDLLRHIGRGDSAALVGAAQLASDLETRRAMYTPAEIAAQYDAASEEVRASLQAYADGVNRYMAEAAATGELPGEYAALAHGPEPWRPTDSVAVINVLLGRFGVYGGTELRNARLLHTLTASLGSIEAAYAALGDLNGLRVRDAYTTIAPADKVVEGCERPLRFGDVPGEQVALALKAEAARPWGTPEGVEASWEPGSRALPGLLAGFRWGSNALALHGDHTTTGLPMMFGGPQMGYFKPPIAYEVGLHGAGFDATGVGVAGAPGIVIGRTPQFAWSVTSGMDDQVDTVALPLDPSDRHRFRWGDRWEAMACHEEVHRVAASVDGPGAPGAVVQEVCRARGMPVVAWSPEDDLAWAQRTTTRGKELDAAAMWFDLARQADLAGFQEALRHFPYTFNFHYAGPEGIAYFHTGDVPLRDPGLDPRLPALAGDDHAWRGETVGLALGTWAVNPPQGYAANWNNPPAAGWRKGDEANSWDGIHRAGLLDHFVRRAIADGGGRVSWAAFQGILRDAATHDPFAGHTAPRLVAAARASGDPALGPLADALDAWGAAAYPWRDADGDGRYDDPGHAVWDAARLALQDLVFRDELGDRTPVVRLEPRDSPDPHAGDHGSVFNKDAPLVHALSGATAHDWCDDVRTAAREGCGQQLLAAMRAAREELEERFGTPDVGRWNLDVHRSRFQPMGASRPEDIPMVNRGSWNQVVAIGQGLEGAGGILPPGNSGRTTLADFAATTALRAAEPARLTAQLGRYVEFRFKPLPVTPDEVAQVATEVRQLAVLPGPRAPVAALPEAPGLAPEGAALR